MATDDEASDLIEEALNQALKMRFDDHEMGDVLSAWMIIGHVSNIDPEKGDAYPMLYSNGGVPKHVARGLLHTALKLLEQDD